MTMIVAILIITYKKINGLKGFKIPKLRFKIELENDIVKEIVKMCGGDPEKAALCRLVISFYGWPNMGWTL